SGLNATRAMTDEIGASLGFIAPERPNCYIAWMNSRRPNAYHAIVLQDHARLPGRFFGQMTAAVLAGL
ncbi:MAG: hypothetical protein K8F62_17670, partial [Pseudorhodoplanes sp.]|nr:hypothetical protein [Pseudorhodoplanes sp.]